MDDLFEALNNLAVRVFLFGETSKPKAQGEVIKLVNQECVGEGIEIDYGQMLISLWVMLAEEIISGTITDNDTGHTYVEERIKEGVATFRQSALAEAV